MRKAICIIDGGFIREIVKQYGEDLKLNYHNLVQKMTGDIPLLRSYYYDCPPYTDTNPSDAQKEKQKNFNEFRQALVKLSQLEFRLGRIKRTFVNGKPKYTQKGVDTLMAIDLVTFSTKRLITHAVLMTGDSDLVPAVQVAKNEGVIVKVITFSERKKSTADQLLETADIVEVWDKSTIDMCCTEGRLF